MTYRAGIIGAGGIAGMGILGFHDDEDIGKEKIDSSHAGGYNDTGEIDLVTVADVDEEKLDTFGEAWEIPSERRYVSHQTMLVEENLDVVSVCTPSFLHHDHVVDAVESEFSPDVIWCEKPIASSVTDAEHMVDLCRETGTELVINHSFRFTEKLQTLKEHMRDGGLLGDVHSISAQFRMELLRNSTHLLDTLIYLLDSRAEDVSGYITGENQAVNTLNAGQIVDDSGGGGYVIMDDGTFTAIDCTPPRDESSMTLNFIGSNGKLYMNNDDGEWRYWNHDDEGYVEESLPGIKDAWTWEGDYTRSFANAAQHLQELLNGEAENHSTGEEAKRSLEIIVAFYISHYTGSDVSIPLERPLQDVEITSW